MTPAEQEALFKKVQTYWDTPWGPLMASGYVHGIVDEARRTEPKDLYVREVRANPEGFDFNSYARGYLFGFADARGYDILGQEWAKGPVGRVIFEDGEDGIDFEWWKKEDD